MKNRVFSIIIGVIFILSMIFNVLQTQKIKHLNKIYTDCVANVSPTYEYLDSLTVDSFEKKVAHGLRVLVYIGRPDCNDCITFEPILEFLVNKYNLSQKLMYVNVKKLRSESEERWNKFKRDYSFTQTPAILLFDKGKYIDGIEWNDQYGLPSEKLVQWFKKNDIL